METTAGRANVPGPVTIFGRLFARVYFPGSHVPLDVSFLGSQTLRFDPGEGELLAVSIEEMDFEVVPFMLPLPPSLGVGEGLVEISGLRIRTSDLDTGESGGEFDPTTGDITITLSIVVDLSPVPAIAEAGLAAFPIRFEDRGVLDLETGFFEMHHGAMEITEGPLAGAVIIGSFPPGEISSSPSITLGAAVRGAPGNPCDHTFKEVWVCPGDQVVLCWDASDVTSVDLAPGGHTGLPLKGSMVLWAPQQDQVYAASGIGGSSVPVDEVTVRVVPAGGRNIPYQATPAGREWAIDVSPYSVSGKLHANALNLLSSPGKCLDWSHFQLEHLPWLGGVPLHAYGWSHFPRGVRIAGKWSFWPVKNPTPSSASPPDPKDIKLPVCFELQTVCQ